MKSFLHFVFGLLVQIVFILPSFAQEEQESLLVDSNADGLVTFVGFGDSITFGVGDEVFPRGGGYVVRLAGLTGISTDNEGVPGEEIVAQGIYRFPEVIQQKAYDVVQLFEGTNDAVHQVATQEVRRATQKAINTARALEKIMVVTTLPAPCCDHASLAPYTTSYNSAIRELALLNEVRIVDIEKAWQTTCTDTSACELYNLPEGLHPNAFGYDVIAQTVAATLLGIDIFAPDGAANLESALGLEPGTVVVKPALMSTIANGF